MSHVNLITYDDVKTSPRPRSRYIILEDITYKDVVVPAGYVTNGADIPRMFWSYIPPNLSDIMPAVVIHDYLCDIAINIEDYEKADRYFNDILLYLKVKKHQQVTLSVSVKLYTKTIRRIKKGL